MSRSASKQSRKSSRKSSSAVPSFLLKLYDMLETPNESIAWNKDGNSFIVKNINEFSESVLPKFFKHNNFASFVRQLNMYDFHKIRHENQEHEFQHRLFKRNAKHLLPQIKRKNAEIADGVGNFPNPTTSCNHVAEIQKLKKELTGSQKEIQTLTGRLSDVEKLSEHLLKQNTNMIADTKNLLQDIAQQGEQKEKNMQKMIYALFSMINNGSLYFTNRKNYPTEQQLSLESDPAQSNSHGQKSTSVPEGTKTTVSVFENNGNEQMSFDLGDLSKQISSSLFGNNNSNEKNGFLSKHLKQLSVRERENKKIAQRFFNTKFEEDDQFSELSGNLPLENKEAKIVTRNVSQKSSPPVKKEETKETGRGRRKKVKVEETNGTGTTWNETPQMPLIKNLEEEDNTNQNNHLYNSMGLLHSPEPQLPSPLGLSPRNSSIPPYQIDEFASNEKPQALQFVPEDVFLAPEKPKTDIVLDDLLNIGGAGEPELALPRGSFI